MTGLTATPERLTDLVKKVGGSASAPSPFPGRRRRQGPLGVPPPPLPVRTGGLRLFREVQRHRQKTLLADSKVENIIVYHETYDLNLMMKAVASVASREPSVSTTAARATSPPASPAPATCSWTPSAAWTTMHRTSTTTSKSEKRSRKPSPVPTNSPALVPRRTKTCRTLAGWSTHSVRSTV